MPSNPLDPLMLARSRELRKAMTPEESRLWYSYLRYHPARFRRQAVIGRYIADFYCPSARLVIELDGSQHFEPDALDYDAKRTASFAIRGISVLRFTNADIRQRFRDVCETVEHALSDARPNKE